MQPPRAAVVGSGPAGFYAADQLLNADFSVDVFDRLPTPFGLVRAGVAPDHPNIKAVTAVFTRMAERDGFHFFGGVSLGEHITRAELLEHYHVVVYALGTAIGRRLGIPGEDLPGSYAATEFVGWYNGHPEFADRSFMLNGRRAIVIGNGNVAIDVARMLALAPEELAATDCADHAIEALAESQINEVVLVGRRGPAQAAFTNPELRELTQLSRANVAVDPDDLVLDAASAAWLDSEAAKPIQRRNVETLRAMADSVTPTKPRRIVLRFLRSPVEILGTERVEAIRVAVNRIEMDATGALRAVATAEEEVIDCDIVLRSIGYRGVPVGDLPFDLRNGLIRNRAGRVCDALGKPHIGEYVTGWIKRGPSGVIGTNKRDSAQTVAAILEDARARRLNEPLSPDRDAIDQWILERAPDAVTWVGWKAIDGYEKARGRSYGRPRVKLVRIKELVEVSQAAEPADALSVG